MNLLDRFVSWVYPDPKPEEPPIHVHYEWLKMQAEREDRRDDWDRKFKQEQIDRDYWWEYVEMRSKDELKIIDILRSNPKGRLYSLWDTGYIYGLLINPMYQVVHNSAKYRSDGGVNIHQEYEDYMNKQRPNSTWDIIDNLRKQLKEDKS